jgi:hypothetical protein
MQLSVLHRLAVLEAGFANKLSVKQESETWAERWALHPLRARIVRAEEPSLASLARLAGLTPSKIQAP